MNAAEDAHVLLREVWTALGCAPDPDDFKPEVRARQRRQAIDMIREEAGHTSRVYRENEQLRALLAERAASAARLGVEPASAPLPWSHEPYGQQNQNGDYVGGDVLDANGEYVVGDVADDVGRYIVALTESARAAATSDPESQGFRLVSETVEAMAERYADALVGPNQYPSVPRDRLVETLANAIRESKGSGASS